MISGNSRFENVLGFSYRSPSLPLYPLVAVQHLNPLAFAGRGVNVQGPILKAIKFLKTGM